MDASYRKLHGKVTRAVRVEKKNVLTLAEQATPQTWTYYRLLEEISRHLERALRETEAELEKMYMPIDE